MQQDIADSRHSRICPGSLRRSHAVPPFREARHSLCIALKRFSRRAWILLLLGWTMVACAPVPAPEMVVHVDSDMVEVMRERHAEMLKKFPPYEDPVIQNYVQSLGGRLAAVAPRTDLPIRITVVDSPGAFAYSFAHGEVIVSRGMLIHLNSEAQLAAVLAHEIGHIVSSHQAVAWQELRKLSELETKLSGRFSSAQAGDALRTLSLARARGYSREHEIEADVWSERLLARAGYDVGAETQVLRFLMQQNSFWDKLGFELWEIPEPGGGDGVFATHPSTEVRLDLAIRRLGAAARAPAMPDPAYLNALRGMVFGLPERHGIQRGAHYVHPATRVGFTVPEGWYLFGAEDRLVAASRNQDGLLMVWMKPRTGSEPMRRALEDLARGHALELVQPLATPFASGETAVTRFMADGESRTVRLAVMDVGGQRLSAVGLTFTQEGWARTDAGFRELLRSVRTLTETEAGGAQPLRVQIEQARIERPLAPLTQPFADHPRERWELLNQLYPSQHVTTGHWIKTVR